MPIYLKKRTDGRVDAYGDEYTLKAHGGEYDIVVSESDWKKNLCGAHLENGAVVLGHGTERLKEIVREERDYRLLAHCDKITPVRWAGMTEDERTAWTNYRQALLDVPQQDGFPWNGIDVPWPTKPGDEEE